ncbi:MAG: (2Fe-2S) ferredoxin domain-containing protein [Fibrobacteres bacterium]|nr:(2Fe-2S) ferredoxin domain-containing protein [Fibrobacterota bacterium]
MAKLTKESLEKRVVSPNTVTTNYIRVGMSTCGVAAGADDVYAAFIEEADKRKTNMKILKCGCIGACYAEPLVEVAVEGMPTVLYGKVNRETAVKILDKHILQKTIVQDFVFDGILRR